MTKLSYLVEAEVVWTRLAMAMVETAVRTGGKLVFRRALCDRGKHKGTVSIVIV